MLAPDSSFFRGRFARRFSILINSFVLHGLHWTVHVDVLRLSVVLLLTTLLVLILVLLSIPIIPICHRSLIILTIVLLLIRLSNILIRLRLHWLVMNPTRALHSP